ncbi:MAG TPA: sigma-70 family RNA polymerase sigma factor [Sphingobacteriaceae bacterium]|nr:sigma-70 family RNA polymerase sigma factor [Sphingobacteriaceae bacterium]
MSRNQTLLQEDQDLIDGITNGSTESLRIVYKDHFPLVAQYIIKNSGSEEDAKDVFQEAIIVLYDKINKGDFILSSRLQTYIYSVSRFIWLKKLNSNNPLTVAMHQELEETLAVEDDLQESNTKEMQFHLMEESLNLLGEPCQTIIKDFYIHDLSMQEICEKFGYTNANNAKTQKYKCLQRLKKLYFSY